MVEAARHWPNSPAHLAVVNVGRRHAPGVSPAGLVAVTRAVERGFRRARKRSRGCSSAGRAPHWQCGGQGFESPQLHHRASFVAGSKPNRGGTTDGVFCPSSPGGRWAFSFVRKGNRMTTANQTAANAGAAERPDRYDATPIEQKWRTRWEESGLYRTDLTLASGRPKFYNLMEFPYPSAEGLHIGHVYTYGGADTNGRFQRMRGIRSLRADGLRRLRHPQRELRAEDRHQPDAVDRAHDAPLPRGATGPHRRDVRLVAQRGHQPAEHTTAGRSGSSCNSTRRGWPCAKRRR